MKEPSLEQSSVELMKEIARQATSPTYLMPQIVNALQQIIEIYQNNQGHEVEKVSADAVLQIIKQPKFKFKLESSSSSATAEQKMILAQTFMMLIPIVENCKIKLKTDKIHTKFWEDTLNSVKGVLPGILAFCKGIDFNAVKLDTAYDINAMIARYGEVDMLKKIIEYGSNINKQGGNISILTAAAKNCDLAVLKYLITLYHEGKFTLTSVKVGETISALGSRATEEIKDSLSSLLSDIDKAATLTPKTSTTDLDSYKNPGSTPPVDDGAKEPTTPTAELTTTDLDSYKTPGSTPPVDDSTSEPTTTTTPKKAMRPASMATDPEAAKQLTKKLHEYFLAMPATKKDESADVTIIAGEVVTSEPTTPTAEPVSPTAEPATTDLDSYKNPGSTPPVDDSAKEPTTTTTPKKAMRPASMATDPEAAKQLTKKLHEYFLAMPATKKDESADVTIIAGEVVTSEPTTPTAEPVSPTAEPATTDLDSYKNPGSTPPVDDSTSEPTTPTAEPVTPTAEPTTTDLDSYKNPGSTPSVDDSAKEPTTPTAEPTTPMSEGKARDFSTLPLQAIMHIINNQLTELKKITQDLTKTTTFEKVGFFLFAIQTKNIDIANFIVEKVMHPMERALLLQAAEENGLTIEQLCASPSDADDISTEDAEQKLLGEDGTFE